MHDDEYQLPHDRYDEYEPRRYRDYEDDYRRRGRYDDDDYPRRSVRHRGVPWYATLIAAIMLGVAALALIGNGIIFCVGFNAEFIRNARPDPVGVGVLAGLALAIVASVFTLFAGYSILVGRRYWLGIVGCIAVALCTHVFILGLPAGIVALVLLLQPEVKESFR
jgi:hypothetical protein